MQGILVVWGIIGGVIALFGYIFLHLYENFFIYLFVFSAIGILAVLLNKNGDGNWHVLRTYNIDFESSRKIQKLFNDIEEALKARVGAGNVKRLPGGISVMNRGVVKAKFIPWKNQWGNEIIMLGVSATIEDQNWGGYEFPEKYLIGVGGNEQPFYFMTLPQDQTAIDDSINIVGMISEKLNPSYSGSIGWPKHRFIFCKEINDKSFLLITVRGNSYNLRSLDNRTWLKGFKQNDAPVLEELVGKYSFSQIVEVSPKDRHYSVQRCPEYWQERIRELNALHS